jgi:hypothetical protein
MTNDDHRICFMLDLHKSGSHGCITDKDRAEAGLKLLIGARELFKSADNKRTLARVEAAISSAKGAVRIQVGRAVRAQLTFAALRCGGCGEAATAATDTTHRQWHCGCCGSWNDAPAGTEIVIGQRGEELRRNNRVAQ